MNGELTAKRKVDESGAWEHGGTSRKWWRVENLQFELGQPALPMDTNSQKYVRIEFAFFL